VQAARTAAVASVAEAAKTLELVRAMDSLRRGDDAAAVRDYAPAVAAYTRWLEMVGEHADEDPHLLFRVLHNRAVGNLRLGRHDDVLADAAGIVGLEKLGPLASGSAHLLSALARLGQGMTEEALAEVGRAVEADPHVKLVIPDDEDLARWLAANQDKARAFVRDLNKLIAPARLAVPPPAPAPAKPAAARRRG